MSQQIICNVCGQPMKNLGNINGIVLKSWPEQWDEVYICEQDKMKKTVRVFAKVPGLPDLSEYMEQRPKPVRPKPMQGDVL